MSKENQSRIPTRGLTRIPLPGSNQIKPAGKPQQPFTSKLAKPSDVSNNFVKPTAPAQQKISHITKPNLPNLARNIPRSFSSDKIGKESIASQLQRPTNLKKNLLIKKSQESILKLSHNVNLNELSTTKSMSAVPASASRLFDDDDQMLIDETIDLVGSEENVSRLSGASGYDGTVILNNDTVTYNKISNGTFELCRRDGTFIKSPTVTFDKTKTLSQEFLSRTTTVNINSNTFVGSAHNLTKDICNSTHNIPQSSRNNNRNSRENLLMGPSTSYTSIVNAHGETNETKVLRRTVRKSIELDAMNLTGLTNEWNSEDMLCLSFDPSKSPRTPVLNSTMINNRLIDVTPIRPFLNLSANSSSINVTNLLCRSQAKINESDGSTTLVNAESTRTNDGAMEVDDHVDLETEQEPLTDNSERGVTGVIRRNSENRSNIPQRQRYSFGLDLTECTLDCSIELCEPSSLSSTMQYEKMSPMSNFDKQGSFEVDESLGILTPDQMKEFLDSTATNNTNNLDLPLVSGHKLSHTHCRVDQTPSPEELPLDPVGVKTDITEVINQQQRQQIQQQNSQQQQEISQTDTDSKTEQLTKSVASKVSNSFITSITSITSDTGYIGDGEMSRPASRGAADQSPSKEPKVGNGNQNPVVPNVNWNAQPVPRRQDPMTDSDFFTESDADDIFHRADQRRAQVIDGQLYGPMLQGANVFINQQPQMDDSCMESSGVFTDIENRGDDDLIHRLEEHRDNIQLNVNDMSPDVSTDTISSSNTACSQRKIITTVAPTHQPQQSSDQVQCQEFINLINVSASSINTSVSSSTASKSACDDCIDTINLISDVSFGSTKSTINEAANKPNDNISSTKQIQSATSGLHSKKPGSIGKKLLNSSRKYSKNESNYGLKKHEMSRSGLNKLKLSKHSVANASGYTADDSQDSKNLSAKRSLNGKWDAVMNKIAENKNIKKNFSDVKPKVTCGFMKPGVLKRSSPSSSSAIKSPPSDDHSFISLDSTPGKHSSGTGAKRGRTFSKDSQQSSQSDLSFNDGSPKISSKNVTIRSAKKRDVRTISSSPSDLGPPSKTNTNGTPRSNRITTPIQKRASQQNGAAVNQIPELKGSPPAKKVVPRRVQTSTTNTTTTTTASNAQNVKSPLKDHNRLVGPTTTNTASKVSSGNNSPRSSIRGASNQSSQQQSASNRNGTIILDSLSISSKTNCKQNDIENNNNNSNKIVNKNNNASAKKSAQQSLSMQQQQQKQQQLDQQMHEKQVIDLTNLIHANKGVEALGVLVQYLVFNLDAFSCPTLKKQHQKTTKELLETRNYLDEVKTSCQNLEDKLADKEVYFQQRESELQELHRCEMMKAEKAVVDTEENSRKQIELLHREMTLKQELAEEKLRAYIRESENKISYQDQELQAAKERESEMQKRIAQLMLTENELREKVHNSELEYSERLHVAQIRERELTDKINMLTKQAEDLKIQAENDKRELEEKLNLSQDELTIIRHSRSSLSSESFHNKTINLNQSQVLQDEVESLRCVLELKQSEISELRKQNHELQRSADEAIAAQIRISGLESRIEDLQVQLQAKHEEEKEFMQKLKQLQDMHSNEVKKGNRLSLHNEELQWRLKQNSEKYSMAISELSKSYHEQSSFRNTSFHDFNDAKSNGSMMEECFGDDDCDGVSPPTSPIIKGVVEKSDSVSWVLEMDDETPEALATRMVRRAGSFRSDKCSPSPVPKRQKCQNNTSIQQSASAASILRHHSEPSPQKLSAPSVRSRSKSMCTKSKSTPEPPKKITRANNSASKRMEIPASWRDHKSSVSANKKVDDEEEENPLIIDESSKEDFLLEEQELNDVIPFSRSRSSTFNTGDAYEQFHRDKAPNFKKSRENRGLITCDTAALASAQKQKKNLKLRRPKIAAGEAMVSGSNSEDDEVISASSSSSSSSATCSNSCSTTSTSPSSPSNSSSHSGNIEDTLMRKIVARLNHSGNSRMELLTGNNTPMEVSWSEEGEPSESIA